MTREEYLRSLGITHEYIGVRLKLGEKAYLERLAERAGMNLSNYVKTAINAYIGENKFTLGKGRGWKRK